MTRSLVAATIASCLLVSDFTYAQFAVFDGAQAANAARQIAHEAQQLLLIKNQIQIMTAEVQQIKANAQYLFSKHALRAYTNQVLNSYTLNRYGEMITWNPAVNQGANPRGAWQNATVVLRPLPFLNGQPLGMSSDIANVGSVEAADGAGVTALGTIGNTRAQLAQMDAAIDQLQQSAQDTSTTGNSEAAQLNLLTAGSVQSLAMQQASNNALISLLEEQTISNKIGRDSLVDDLNSRADLAAAIAAMPTTPSQNAPGTVSLD